MMASRWTGEVAASASRSRRAALQLRWWIIDGSDVEPQSHCDRTRVCRWCPTPRFVCACEWVFFPPAPKLKFGANPGVIGGLERDSQPPPGCFSCHVGGVDLVRLWESKVPLTAAGGVIHRAPNEEGRGGGLEHCLQGRL